MPNYVYTVNTSGNVNIGQAIPNAITQYTTPEAAMAAFNNRPFFLRHRIQNDVVSESYVGFVVTSAMAQANSGMTAGTYYLRGLDIWDTTNDTCKTQYLNGEDCISPYYEVNKAVLQSAFGTSSSYCGEHSSDFICSVSGLNARAEAYGYVYANVGREASCNVRDDGASDCIG